MLGKLPAQSESRSGIPSEGVCFSVPTARRKSLTHTYTQENKHTASEAQRQQFMQKEGITQRKGGKKKKKILTSYWKIFNNLLDVRSSENSQIHRREVFLFCDPAQCGPEAKDQPSSLDLEKLPDPANP